MKNDDDDRGHGGGGGGEDDGVAVSTSSPSLSSYLPPWDRPGRARVDPAQVHVQARAQAQAHGAAAARPAKRPRYKKPKRPMTPYSELLLCALYCANLHGMLRFFVVSGGGGKLRCLVSVRFFPFRVHSFLSTLA